MISAALLTTLALTAGPGVDVQAPERAALGVSVEATHITLVNTFEAPLLLVATSEDGRFQALHWLPAGGRYDEDFPRGTLHGLELEVARPLGQGWLTSGSLDLDPMALESAELWVLDCGHAVAREEGGASFSTVAPRGSHLPPQWHSVTADEAQPAAACHVPVVTPSDEPKGDKPPKLRRKPLPPV
ncbi:MAG: hypothetical protein H6828_13115 [Planctomycetes bacterium]|nr:hypothetical protein [Planctomycetota bacterium]